MAREILYIVAGNAKEASDFARSLQIKPEEYRYVSHEEVLMGVKDGASYVLTGSYSSRSDLIDLEKRIRERKMKMTCRRPTMTDDKRKLLTKAIGEEWAEPYACNRTFDNWTDFGALRDSQSSKQWKTFIVWLSVSRRVASHAIIEDFDSWMEWEQKTPGERCEIFAEYLEARHG